MQALMPPNEQREKNQISETTASQSPVVRSELRWIIGYIEGVRIGQAWPEAQPLTVSVLDPIDKRLRGILGIGGSS